jgi:hypothetical protein
MKLSHTRIVARSAMLLAGACFQWSALAAEGAGGAWRCGNTYTDHPCTGGKALDLDDARDADQKRSADASTREAQAAAERMKSDRLRLEARQQRPILIDAKPKESKKTQAGPDKDVAKKPQKGKKDAVYMSWQGAEAPPKKKSKKAGGKSGE